MPASWALAEFGFGESQRPHLTSAMFCLCVLGGWLYLPKTPTSPMRSQFTAFLCSAFFHGSHLLSACQALPRTSRLPPSPLFSSISAIGSQFLSSSPHWLNFVPPGGEGHPCLGAFASAALRVALVPEDTHGSDFCSPLTCLLPTDLICLPQSVFSTAGGPTDITVFGETVSHVSLVSSEGQNPELCSVRTRPGLWSG